MDRKIIIILTAIVSLSGAVRLFEIDKSPPSLNWDEASFGYNAYSIWKTAKDEYGTLLPWSFRAFDDYKPPIYSYMTAPIVGIFGLNQFNVRLLGALSGVMSVILLFALTLKFSNSKITALAAAGMMAVDPWAVNFSRSVFEANVSLVFSLASIYLLEKGKSSIKYYLYAVILAAIGSFAYNSGKVYLALAIVWVIFKLKTKIFNKKLLTGLGLCLLPVAITAVFGSSLARFSATSIFKLWNGDRSVYLFSGEIINRYVSYFSPVNLFVRGTNEPNQSVHGFGVFYSFEVVFFILGIISLLRNNKTNKQLLFWLAVSPIPAILTWSWFTPVRVLPFWAMVTIVDATGLVFFIKLIKYRYIKLAGIAGIGIWWVINICWLMATLLWYVPYMEYGKWQWGFKEAAAMIKPMLSSYDKVIWESPHAQPHIFTLFYLAYPPDQYQKDLGSPNAVPIPRTNFDFGKFVYRKIYWPDDRGLKNTLFIGGVYSLPLPDIQRDHVKFMKDIIDPQGYVFFRIVGT